MATLLATLIEIPSVARAGVKERVWRRSLLANVISTVVGIFFPAYLAASSEHIDIFIALAVVLSILIEGAYLTWAVSRRLNWGWLTVGNVTSAVVLLWLSSVWAVSVDKRQMLCEILVPMSPTTGIREHIVFVVLTPNSWMTQGSQNGCLI